MVNRSVPIYKNPIYSDILFRISKEGLTSTELAKRLNKKQSPVSRQLKYLEKEGYILSDIKKRQFNRKLYFVNWNRVGEDFYKVTRDFLKEKNRHLLDLFDYKKTVMEAFKEEKFILFIKYSLSSFQSRIDLSLERFFLALVRVLSKNKKSIKKIIRNKDFLKDMMAINLSLDSESPEFHLEGCLYEYIRWGLNLKEELRRLTKP